ncbi:hypothetical protein Syun_004663 [Stephania yunnanensis]|uniref:Cytochrome P450 n=1 Tax=Stephania yunnanensis TaxID=152371 RepID=A0AAP0L3P4_9MAGN
MHIPSITMEMLYCIALVTLFLLLSKLFLHRKPYPSNPLSLPIIGHLHLIIKKPLHRTLANLAKRYGPVMFLRYGSRRVLVASSASTIQQCLTTNDIAFGNRPHLVVGEYLGYNFTSLVWSRFGDHWRSLRRILTVEIFSGTRLQMYSSLRVEEVHSLIKQVLLKANCDYDKFTRVEFKMMFFELMLNIMMRTISGKRYCGEDVDELDEAKRFRRMVSETCYLMGTSNLGDFFPWLRWFDFQGLERRVVETHRERDSFMQSLIDEHRERGNEFCAFSTKEGEKKKTLISVLLELQEEDPQFFVDDIIKGITSNLLTAGTDTSSATMEWALSLLLNHPTVLKKAQDEIDAQVGQQRLLSESDLANLPYLHSIVNETLRLYPTGPIVTHESAQDCFVEGFRVPAGTMLQMNLWALHRDPKVWDEPNEFRPERFEGLEWDNLGFKLIPFGSGRRRCPGEGLAMRMIGLTVGLLVQCFDWEREEEEMVDMSEGVGLTLPRAKPLGLCVVFTASSISSSHRLHSVVSSSHRLHSVVSSSTPPFRSFFHLFRSKFDEQDQRLRDFIKHVHVDRRYTGNRIMDKPTRGTMHSGSVDASSVELKRGNSGSLIDFNADTDLLPQQQPLRQVLFVLKLSAPVSTIPIAPVLGVAQHVTSDISGNSLGGSIPNQLPPNLQRL